MVLLKALFSAEAYACPGASHQCSAAAISAVQLPPVITHLSRNKAGKGGGHRNKALCEGGRHFHEEDWFLGTCESCGSKD